ncbi:hypothetical protein FME95_03195 [Reinekea thalattae]|uniref:Uncharacterized protein n=1 Tax=Reinekea thalattae TaxID=2593301 RepID=A0A5C8ZAG8_9GAMM|nr:hypothetical protein FME95_03195 [Reinekea thalattae]
MGSFNGVADNCVIGSDCY